MSAQLKELLDYVEKSGFICPQPRVWHKLWKMLPNRKRVGSGWSPPLPLILTAWWYSGHLEKHERFREHLMWAEKHNVIGDVAEYLYLLSEDDWLY